MVLDQPGGQVLKAVGLAEAVMLIDGVALAVREGVGEAVIWDALSSHTHRTEEEEAKPAIIAL